MDEKKPPAKGIKLNVSQLPLSNKADFVLGADSRKVLDNKIIENLGGTGSHGYFPSSASRTYKSWSVSRELEIPSQADLAEAQMRMIEGASAATPLQNESSGTTASHADPFFTQGSEADSNPFAHEPQHAETVLGSQDSSYVQSGANPYETQDSSYVQSGANPYETQDSSYVQSSVNPFDAPPPNRLNNVKPNPLDANQSNPFDIHKPNPFDAQGVSTKSGTPKAEPNFGAGSSFAHEFGDNTNPAEAADPALAAQLQDTFRETLPKRTPSLTPAADPELAAKLVETVKENVPQKLPAQPVQPIDADSPSPWSGPVTDAQAPVVVRQGVPQPASQQLVESPWAAPVLDKQPPMAVSADMSPQVAPAIPPQVGSETSTNSPDTSDSDDGWVFVGAEESVPTPAPHVSSSGPDAGLIPSWMSAMASDSTTSGGSAEPSEDVVSASAAPSEVEVELETFLNSIPDEEFIIDNETMRHLFSSLCEPKSASLKIKSAASDAADLAIAAAAAEILNTEVSIDEISIDDIATAEVLAAEQSPEADFEAIQQAYAMLDLSPLPPSQRKEGSFDNVFDVVKKAADDQESKVEQVAADSSANVARTERGTIEMAIHAGGRQLVPQYNFCGMLTGVEMSDGLSFMLSEEKNTWQMIEQSGKVMVSGIKSVSFDKQGNLSYVTKRGDTVTLKVDGTIDTKFAKKSAVGTAVESAEASQEVAAEVPQQAANGVPQETAPVVPEPKAPTAPSGKVKTAAKDEKAAVKETKAAKSTKSVEIEKKPAKPVTKKTQEPVTKASANVKQAKPSTKPPAKPPAKPQAKETKPTAKGSSKPKKKGR